MRQCSALQGEAVETNADATATALSMAKKGTIDH
jgi:hypothetical protein